MPRQPLSAQQPLVFCHCSIVAASNWTRRAGRLSMTRSLGPGSGCTGWGWRKSPVTEPSDPSAGAVLETALAQICHDGLSMTVANADICPADQSLHTWSPVQTKKLEAAICREQRREDNEHHVKRRSDMLWNGQMVLQTRNWKKNWKHDDV